MRRWLAAGLLFGVLWLFVRGVELAPDAVLGQFILGLAVGMPVAYVFRRLYSEGLDPGRTLSALPYAVLYVLVFLREIVVANLDVAYRVLAPGTPIDPQVIFVPLRVETDLGVTTIANSITITPGTITLDHDPEENALYVHVIDGRDPEAIVDPIRTWEDYALVIFDERLSPDDPRPEIAVHPEDRNPPRPADRLDRADREPPEEDRRGDPGDRRRDGGGRSDDGNPRGDGDDRPDDNRPGDDRGRDGDDRPDGGDGDGG